MHLINCLFTTINVFKVGLTHDNLRKTSLLTSRFSNKKKTFFKLRTIHVIYNQIYHITNSVCEIRIDLE